MSWDLDPDVDYQLEVVLKGNAVAVLVDRGLAISHEYSFVLTDGDFGLLAGVGGATFDEVTLEADDPRLGGRRFGGRNRTTQEDPVSTESSTTSTEEPLPAETTGESETADVPAPATGLQLTEPVVDEGPTSPLLTAPVVNHRVVDVDQAEIPTLQQGVGTQSAITAEPVAVAVPDLRMVTYPDPDPDPVPAVEMPASPGQLSELTAEGLATPASPGPAIRLVVGQLPVPQPAHRRA